MNHFKIFLSCCLFIVVSGCSNAVEGVGSIDADIGGDSYRGVTLGKTGEHQASAILRSFGPITMLSIQAHDLHADSMMQNVFSVEVSVSNADYRPAVVSATISYWPKGMSEKFYTSEETQVNVTLEQFKDGDNSSVSGSFSGRICAKANFYSAINRSDCKDINGTFDTPLFNES